MTSNRFITIGTTILVTSILVLGTSLFVKAYLGTNGEGKPKSNNNQRNGEDKINSNTEDKIFDEDTIISLPEDEIKSIVIDQIEEAQKQQDDVVEEKEKNVKPKDKNDTKGCIYHIDGHQYESSKNDGNIFTSGYNLITGNISTSGYNLMSVISNLYDVLPSLYELEQTYKYSTNNEKTKIFEKVRNFISSYISSSYESLSQDNLLCNTKPKNNRGSNTGFYCKSSILDILNITQKEAEKYFKKAFYFYKCEKIEKSNIKECVELYEFLSLKKDIAIKELKEKNRPEMIPLVKEAFSILVKNSANRENILSRGSFEKSSATKICNYYKCSPFKKGKVSLGKVTPKDVIVETESPLKWDELGTKKRWCNLYDDSCDLFAK
jgi:hypothetical protein